jgi:uncharacterized protein
LMKLLVFVQACGIIPKSTQMIDCHHVTNSIEMQSVIVPIQNKDREVFMDVLRGFAILGILIANLTMGGLSLYSANTKQTGAFLWPDLDHKLSFLYAMFIDGKFYSIFSLLFGWGIALQIQSGIDKGVDAIPTIQRRLMFMLLLGSVHILIWNGDIVLFYAMLGFLLLPFRRFTDKTLLITGATLILLPIILYAAKMQWQWLNAPSNILYELGGKVSEQLTGVGSDADYLIWVEKANWWDILKSNMGGVFFRFGYLLFISRIPKVLGMFLIGFVLGRSNFYLELRLKKQIPIS